MRLCILNLLVGAILFIGAANASAFGVFLTSDYAGGVAGASDIITVTAHIDFEGEDNFGLEFLTVGVRFDNEVLTYNQAASPQTSTYLLYAPPNGATPMSLLIPASTCSTAGCQLWAGGGLDPGESQVNIDWLEPNLGTTTSNFLGGLHGDVLATLVFHVAAVGDGLGEIDLVFDLATGQFWQDIWVGPGLPLNLSGSFTVLTPEPTTALLVMLGLAGLGVVGRTRPR